MNKQLGNAKKLYIDANIVIYLLEDQGAFRQKALDLLEFGEDHGIALVTSEITIAECLYGAHKKASAPLAQAYERFFYEIGVLHLIPVDRDILNRSARIGSTWRLKLIDAIHVAAALEIGCDAFVTNDLGIRSHDEFPVIQILDL